MPWLKASLTCCSCVSSDQAAGRALWESTGGSLTGHPSPLELHSSSDTRPWTLPKPCKQVCLGLAIRLANPEPELLTISWFYLGPTHHCRLAWWSPVSWLTPANIMDLLYSFWLPQGSWLCWQGHCPACFVVTQLPARFSLPSNPLRAPWQVG